MWKGCGILDHSQVFNSHQSNHSHLLAEPENAPLQDGRWLGPENLPQRPAWVHVFFVFLHAIQAMPKNLKSGNQYRRYNTSISFNISPMQWISVTAYAALSTLRSSCSAGGGEVAGDIWETGSPVFPSKFFGKMVRIFRKCDSNCVCPSIQSLQLGQLGI